GTPRGRTRRVVRGPLPAGGRAEIGGVPRFAFNGEAATWIALQRPPAEPPTPDGPPSPSPVAPVASMAAATEHAASSDLMLHKLATGAELTLNSVGDWAFDRKGKWLALTI